MGKLKCDGHVRSPQQAWDWTVNPGRRVRAAATGGSGDGFCLCRKEDFTPECPPPHSSVLIPSLMLFGMAFRDSSNLGLDDY